MTSREPWKPQRVGNLRERVTVQDYTTVDDGYGNQVPTWVDLATVWARVEPIKGREAFIAGGIRNPSTVYIHIRHLEGIAPDLRAIHNGKLYNIKRVWNADERGRYLTLECETGA